MAALRNRMPAWYTYWKTVYLQGSITRSPFSSSIPAYGALLRQTSFMGQFIQSCNLSSQSCLRPQLKRLLPQCSTLSGRAISLSSHQTKANSLQPRGTDYQELQQLSSEMNIRLVNENNFLSWCRNAYLSSVVGVAMITEGTTLLSQNAGIGALVVGTMNIFWGTTCHITNLVKLRNVSGMSSFTLFLNILGSFLHCLLWTFVLVCYIGFLDETSVTESSHKVSVDTMLPTLEFQHNQVRKKSNEV